MTTDPQLRRMISVVIPNHNSADAVRRTLASLERARRPAHTDVEVIVCDDGSSDASVETLSVHPDIVLVQQRNAGPASARNRGVSASAGAVVGFLDAGDVVEQSWLGHIAALLDDPRGALVTCAAEVIDLTTGRSQLRTPGPSEAHGVVALPGAFAVRRSVFADLDGYDEALRFGENSDLVERIVDYCSRQGLGIIRHAETQVSIEFGTPSRAYDQRRFEAMQHLLERDREALQTDVDRRTRLEAIAAVNAARCEQWAEARRHARAVVRATPGSARAWARLTITLVPPLARRLWTGQSDRLGTGRPNDVSLVSPGTTVVQVTSAVLYDDSFFAEQRSGSSRSADVVLPIVFELVQPSSLVDIGCGVGTWLAAAQRLGVDQVRGIDGNAVDNAALEIDPSDFRRMDLTDRLNLADERFDMAFCLEVAEHLDPAVSDTIVEQLCGLSDVIVFSAGTPGQLGTGHVNLQWQSAWADRFASRGFTAHDFVRRRVWGNPDVEMWYQQNLLVFVKSSRSDLEERAAFLSSSAPPLLDIVHPDHFTYWVRRADKPVSVRAGLRLTTTALQSALRRRSGRLVSGLRGIVSRERHR